MNRPYPNESTPLSLAWSDKKPLVTIFLIIIIGVAAIFLVRARNTSNVFKAKRTNPSTVTVAGTVLDDAALRQRLTPEQYYVTREEGTEAPFHNEYWDNHAPGIYVDVITGEPLFSSLDKFESGTGWPSFSKPLLAENVVEKTDRTLFMERTEVRAKGSDSHLGHVFDDGPAPTGQRYCMNSAALRFVPADKLEAEGYGSFRALFETKK